MAITKVSLSGVNNIVKYDDILAGNNPQAPYYIMAYVSKTPTATWSDIFTDSSNNVYVVGYINSNSLSLWRITPLGVVELLYSYTNSSSPSATNYSTGGGIDSSGNIYLYGNRTQASSGPIGLQLVKLNSSYVLQWTRKYTIGSSSDYPMYPSDIVVSSSGNSFLLNGNQYAYIGYQPAVGIFATNTSGADKWGSYYLEQGGSQGNYGMRAAVIDNDNLVVTAYRSDGLRQVGTLYRVTGNTVPTVSWRATTWNSAGSGNRNTNYNGVARDTSNNFFICGSYQDDATTSIYCGIVYKYNSSGTIQWYRRQYTGVSGAYTQLFDIAVDSSGNVYAVGTTNISGSTVGYIVKYNTSGTLQWQRTMRLSSGGSLYFNRIVFDAADDMIILGNMYTPNSGDTYYGAQTVYQLKSDGSLTGTYVMTTSTNSYTFVYAAASLTEGSFTPGGTSFDPSNTASNAGGSLNTDTGTVATGTINTYKVKGLS